MSIKEQEFTSFSPGILSMLPLFYVGWSDSVLSPSEMKIIHKTLEEFPFLTKEDRKYLIKWTNPLNPPSEKIFKSWALEIRKFSDNIPHDKKQSLADLGLEIAQASTNYKSDIIWNAPETKNALAEVEEALGINNSVSQNLVFGSSDTDLIENNQASSFSAIKLGKALDGPYAETKERMRKLMRDPFFAYQTIRDKDEYRNHVLEQLKALSKQGLSAYAFSKKYGGLQKSGDHITVFEMLGYHDLSLTIKFGVQFGLFGGAISGLGTEVHHKKYIAPLISAELLGCFAMTETGHGSNVKGLETTATYNKENDSIIINTPHRSAGKEYIGNAIHCSMAAVFAQLIVDGESHGVHAILVPVRDKENNLLPGVEIEDCGYKMGLNGVDNGRLWFTDVEVPRENLLNKYGSITDEGKYHSPIADANKRFFTMLGALVAGRISVGLAGLNASKTALTIAIKYGLKRQQFAGKEGDPETILMDYPSHQRRLLPLLARTHALYFAMSDVVVDYAQLGEDGDTRKIETDAAGLKAIATWHTTNTIQECREACGGKGYLSENRFTDLKADTDIFTTFEGDNTVLLQLVAKGLLTKFKKSFNDEGFRAVMRYLGSRLSQKATEFNPVFQRNTKVSHLMDIEFHKDAFRYREKKLLLTVSQRMQDYLKKRIDPYKAYLKCQTHMIELAKAYVDRMALKAFIKRIEVMEEGPEKKVLLKVYQLFALTTIEDNKGWFLENDYMDGTKSKAIRRVTNKLCQELRYEAEGLVDAFLIPEEMLGAKIILYN
jgi:acyl-CoA oxidase